MPYNEKRVKEVCLDILFDARSVDGLDSRWRCMAAWPGIRSSTPNAAASGATKLDATYYLLQLVHVSVHASDMYLYICAVEVQEENCAKREKASWRR